MNLKEMRYQVDVPEGRIRPFEERILSSGMCDFALDMTFATLRDSKHITYDCGGYIGAGEMDLSDLRKRFEILEKALISLNKAGEFFIDRDKILLNTDTVFYNPKYKNVKLAYYPREKDVIILDNVLGFLEALGERTTAQGKSYLDRVAEIYRNNNCDLSDMIQGAGELRRELFLGDKGLLRDGAGGYVQI